MPAISSKFSRFFRRFIACSIWIIKWSYFLKIPEPEICNLNTINSKPHLQLNHKLHLRTAITHTKPLFFYCLKSVAGLDTKYEHLDTKLMILASQKLTFGPLKNGGLETILSFGVSAYFEGYVGLGRVVQSFVHTCHVKPRPVLNLGGRQSGEQELVHMNHCLEKNYLEKATKNH